MVTAIPKDILDTKILPQIPVGRLGKPEEVAAVHHLPRFGRSRLRDRPNIASTAASTCSDAREAAARRDTSPATARRQAGVPRPGVRRTADFAEGWSPALRGADDRRGRWWRVRPHRDPPVAIANPVTIEEWSGEIGVPRPAPRGDPRRRRPTGRPWRSGRDLPSRAAGDEGLLEPARRDRPGVHDDGWLRTGDMGVMDGRGNIRSPIARRT